MSLRKLRKQWEKSLKLLVEIPDTLSLLFVVLQGEHGYHLHRYFKLGDG